jgi:DNA primase
VEEYHNQNPTNTPNPRRYRGISYTTPINAAKEAVPVIDLADRLCGPGQMRRVGEKWAARCPLPDHEDKTPSFTVYTETNSWYCFGCLRGGDVVELARLAWGYDEREAHVAAANVLHEFGHDVPERAPAWFRKQERQKPVRDALEEVKVRSAQRRLMRIFGDYIAGIEDPDQRREEAQQMWRDLDVIARLIVKEATR